MTEPINPNTHIILYAKHWYKETNVIKYLGRIVGNLYCWDIDHIEEMELAKVLLHLTVDIILSRPIIDKDSKDLAERMITDLVCDLHPNNRWKVGGNESESFELGIIRKCLSILRLTSKKDIPNLGDPDPNILPLNERIKNV